MGHRLEEISVLINDLSDDSQRIAQILAILLDLISDIERRLYSLEEKVNGLDTGQYLLISKVDYEELQRKYIEVQNLHNKLNEVVSDLIGKLHTT